MLRASRQRFLALSHRVMMMMWYAYHVYPVGYGPPCLSVNQAQGQNRTKQPVRDTRAAPLVEMVVEPSKALDNDWGIASSREFCLTPAKYAGV